MTTQRGWSHKPPAVADASRARRHAGEEHARARLRCTCAWRPIRRFGCVPARVAVATVCLWLDPVRAEPMTSPQLATTNQSLTLDPSTPLDEAVPPVDALARPDADSLAAIPTESSPALESATPSILSRRHARPSAAASHRSLADALRSDTRDKPWYRTGLGATAIVVATILALFATVRRWLPRSVAPNSHAIHVAARVPLSPRHSLALVRVGRRYLLLGLSPDHVSTVCEITDELEVAEFKACSSDRCHSPRPFDALFAGESEAYTTQTKRLRADAEPRRDTTEEFTTPRPRGAWNSLTDLRAKIRLLQRQAAGAWSNSS